MDTHYHLPFVFPRYEIPPPMVQYKKIICYIVEKITVDEKAVNAVVQSLNLAAIAKINK